MATSERSLLTVIFPSGPGLRDWLLAELTGRTFRLLLAIDVRPEIARREVEAMRPAVWATTTSRSVLASMTDFSIALDYYLADHLADRLSAQEIMLRFAETPKTGLRKGKNDYGRPAGVALALVHRAWS